MRILLVTDSYPPLVGGATRAAQLLAHEFVRLGHEVSVATVWQKGTAEEEDDDGVRVFRLHGLITRIPWLSADRFRLNHPPFPDLETIWRFRRLLKQVRPDVVHTYGWITYSCMMALAGTTIPLVLGARDYCNVCALRTLVRQGHVCDGPAPTKCLACASRSYGVPKGILSVAGVLGSRLWLRRRIDGLHSCSTYMQATMHQHLLGRNRTIRPDVVIPDFRVESGGTPEQAILDRLPREPYILFVGALRRIKGLEQLFDAYGSLKSPPPLVLIGTPAPDTPASFPPGVTVLRSVPHATVMAAWDNALFGVAPSTLPEPLGNVVHEAMSRGKAMIGTIPGGMSDMIVPEETGMLVPAGDVEALAAAMRRMIIDAPARERMGLAAEQRARLFTAQAVMPQFTELFRTVRRESPRD